MAETTTLELVRPLESFKPSQTRELYRRGDEYIVLSTVDLNLQGSGIGELVTRSRQLMGTGYDYPTSGEETMAFHSDEDGEVTDWSEIAVAKGDGSREAVLEQLRA